VSFSPDNRYLASGSGDGSIKYWDADTGDLLATSIAFNKGEDWIIYTPDNYYNCSLNGDKYVMFRKPGTNDVYPFESFQSVYKRPDIITERLGGEVSEYVANRYGGQQDQRTTSYPPVVFIKSPDDQETVHSNTVDVEIEAVSPDDKVSSIRLEVNGRPAIPNMPQQGFAVSGSRDRVQSNYTVNLVPGENEIKVMVYNSQGIFGSAVRTVIYDVAQNMPDLYILSIGVNDYPGDDYLSTPVSDANSIANTFKTQEGKLYNNVYTKVLTDDQASMGNIMAESATFFENIRTIDVAMIVLAGHGVEQNGLYYFCSYGSTPSNPYSGLSQNILNDQMVNGMLSHVQKIILIIDTCHSGYARTLIASRGDADIEMMYEDMVRGSGFTMIASSTGVERAYEYEGLGLLALVIKKAITTGAADYDDNGAIYLSELGMYIQLEGKNISREHNRSQSPQFYQLDDTRDYPVARVD